MAKNYVSNGGSTLGEAIGNRLELVLETYINKFLEQYRCHYLTEKGKDPKTGKISKKLIMFDDYGNGYDIDGVITNESMQPLVLLESKYIRYKKHNRDKGSWICNSHSAVRKRYHSIRASVAVLAGRWSKPSLEMIKSYDVNIFLIDFSLISQLLSEKGVDFEWEEAEKDRALAAWYRYEALSEKDKMEIAYKMANSIKDQLFALLANILDDTKPRILKHIIVEVKTNRGETKNIKFDTKEEAIEYLENLSLDELFDSASCYTIFDVPEVED